MVDKILEHKAVCDELTSLYEAKNEDYGDSFANARRFMPFYAVGKMFDKVMRLWSLTMRGEENAKVDESIDDTLADLANYAIMELIERRIKRMDINSEMTYRAVQRQYRIEDAKEHLARQLLDDPVLKFFNNEDYNNLVDLFEKRQDCNIAENDVWENVIIEYLREKEN